MSGARATRGATPPLALWVWERPGAAGLVDWASAQGVRDLFVSTPTRLATSADLPWFATLRARTATVGLRMHALGAELSWLEDRAAALVWQRQALATGLFDGVHLNVEPWAHPGWVADPSGLLAAWVDLLRLLAGDTGRPVEADIPFWLHEHSADGRPADEAVMEAVDAVTVMSYRDTATGPDSITGVAASALAAAHRLARLIRLAVETRYLGEDPVSAKQTFHGASRRDLDRALAAVHAALVGQARYTGIAVHDHTGWTRMRA